MIERTTTRTYTGTAKTLHWLILALLIAQFTVAWSMPEIRRDTPVTTLISLHFTVGIVILAVAIVRLAWRVDPWRAGTGRRLAALAVAVGPRVHWLLYTFAVRGADPRLDQRLLARHADRDVRRWNCRGWSPSGRRAGAGPATCTRCLRNIGMLTLVGLHVLAALYHYFVRRDGVLQRMLPGATPESAVQISPATQTTRSVAVFAKAWLSAATACGPACFRPAPTS